MINYQHKETPDQTVFTENHLRTMWVRGRFSLHNKTFEEFMQDYQLVTGRNIEIAIGRDGEPIKMMQWKTPEEWEKLDQQ